MQKIQRIKSDLKRHRAKIGGALVLATFIGIGMSGLPKPPPPATRQFSKRMFDSLEIYSKSYLKFARLLNEHRDDPKIAEDYRRLKITTNALGYNLNSEIKILTFPHVDSIQAEITFKAMQRYKAYLDSAWKKIQQK